MSVSLRPHLLDEILSLFKTSSFRYYRVGKKAGDVMVSLALAGKIPLQQFACFVSHQIGATRGGLQEFNIGPVDSEDGFCSYVHYIHCSSELFSFFARFIRILELSYQWIDSLPTHMTENITDLILGRDLECDAIPVASIMKKIPQIEGLTLYFGIPRFLKSVKNRTIRLNHLERLELHLNVDQFYEVITMKPKFPLPEAVKLHIEVNHHKAAKVSADLRFTQVKKLILVIEFVGDRVNPMKFIKHLPTIIRCFNNVEIPIIRLTYKCHPYYEDVRYPEELYQFLSIATFPVKVDMNFRETYETEGERQSWEYRYKKVNWQNIYNNLKGIGFQDSSEDDVLVIEKVFPRVRLTHYIVHREVSIYSESELTDDSVQTYSDSNSDDEGAISFYKRPGED